jgi:hypothetical protein
VCLLRGAACHASVAAIATHLTDPHVLLYLRDLNTMHKVVVQVPAPHA